ncbi:MAG: fibronectin type III-like domain-contianing protein, partial [Lachnospiraceae bacterium]|nr:fibronectin type III-like domain-contianing protein [Lachnospiraceae bacterium]
KPGETKTVTFRLDYRSFAFFYQEMGDWYVPSGEFVIEAGNSSRNISVSKTITLENTKKSPFVIKPTTTFGELAKYPQIAGAVKEKLMSRMTVFGENKKQSESAAEAITAEMEDATIRYMPIREIRSFGHISNREMEDAVRELNELLARSTEMKE